MKNILLLVGISVLFLLVNSCQQVSAPTPVIDPDPVLNVPFFNQYKTEFRGYQTSKLLDFWYKGRSKESVEFAAINDQKTYQTFFDQTSDSGLVVIDFNRYTLLVGNRGNYGTFMSDGPANIKSVEQDLQPNTNGEWQYIVTVSAKNKGSEWFGFSALVPRIEKPETVKLTMKYKYD
ncbi:hypothetical protein [Spirosoma flavum]|uniref:Lipoprotein n=1 Tax=Spirosoma flavum TaxID=2048557 RepID=A0ABW6ANU8_9BACT